MGSKTSKAKHSTSVHTKTVVAGVAGVPKAPMVPQDIVHEILDYLVADSDLKSLRSCCLVSKSWIQICRRYLFHTIFFTPIHTTKWLEKFPVPGESPAHHVRDLRFLSGGDFDSPERFLEHIPWFINVERVTLLGYGGWETLSQILLLGRFSQSVTSLVINAGLPISALQVQNILVALPSLNNVSLSGSLLVTSRDTLRGMGTVLRGDFGGRLRLIKETTEVAHILLAVPTGLHFTKVEVLGMHECLIATVMLAEECGRSLTKLTYTVGNFCGREVFERTFDFSKLPNLREVNLGLRWIDGGLHWIPMALSTVNPITSPHLFVLDLNLVGPHPGTRVLETSIEGLGNDLRRTTDEVNRIRREFDEGINVVVFRDQWFKEFSESLDLRF